jgi:hypothetical protein
MHAWAIAVVAVTGCAYQPSSFKFQGDEFAGEHVRVGCLDLGIARRPDVDGVAVMAYRFGNRCRNATTIDLAKLRVQGRTAGGEDLTLEPYDPKFELEPLQLDGRWAGGEALAYPSKEPLVQVCVDVGSFAGTPAETWRCFSKPPHQPDEIERLVLQ